MMNCEKFTGKAEAYAKARPTYAAEAIDHICSLVKPDAVFADIGAGTGKFTFQIAQRGYKVFAVEPNSDMRSQLNHSVESGKNVTVVSASAEFTTLDDQSVDVITCAQALHWIDPVAFRKECVRIGKRDCLVIALYNSSRSGDHDDHRKDAVNKFFSKPQIITFSNPVSYNREGWLAYMNSHSHSPLPSDLSYELHIEAMNEIFDREQVGGLISRDIVTTLYVERIDSIIEL